jgi:uncharacterized YigZ family protein
MKYKTIAHSITVEQNIKKSIFIGSAATVQNVSEAKKFIEEVNLKNKNANHNAYAFRVGINGEEVLYTDDGEPSKTAGFPIYNAIRSLGVTNVVVVVTRYFGGTKLGVHGLIEAYGSTSRFALENAGIVERFTQKILCLKFPFNELQFVNYTINRFNGKILKKTFDISANICLEIDEDALQDFKDALLNRKHSISIEQI